METLPYEASIEAGKSVRTLLPFSRWEGMLVAWIRMVAMELVRSCQVWDIGKESASALTDGLAMKYEKKKKKDLKEIRMITLHWPDEVWVPLSEMGGTRGGTGLG